MRRVTTANRQVCYERRRIAGLGSDKLTWMGEANRNQGSQQGQYVPEAHAESMRTRSVYDTQDMKGSKFRDDWRPDPASHLLLHSGGRYADHPAETAEAITPPICADRFPSGAKTCTRQSCSHTP